MLILARNQAQAVVINFGGVSVRVVVHKTRKDRVHLGFDAPDEISILREELYDRPNHQSGNYHDKKLR